GLSDAIQGAPTLEDRMQDLRAVMDAAGSERAALFGLSEGGPMSMLFAATYPDRVLALVLYGAFARMNQAQDYPWGYPPELLERTVEAKVESWGSRRPHGGGLRSINGRRWGLQAAVRGVRAPCDEPWRFRGA